MNLHQDLAAYGGMNRSLQREEDYWKTASSDIKSSDEERALLAASGNQQGLGQLGGPNHPTPDEHTFWGEVQEYRDTGTILSRDLLWARLAIVLPWLVLLPSMAVRFYSYSAKREAEFEEVKVPFISQLFYNGESDEFSMYSIPLWLLAILITVWGRMRIYATRSPSDQQKLMALMIAYVGLFLSAEMTQYYCMSPTWSPHRDHSVACVPHVCAATSFTLLAFVETYAINMRQWENSCVSPWYLLLAMGLSFAGLFVVGNIPGEPGSTWEGFRMSVANPVVPGLEHLLILFHVIVDAAYTTPHDPPKDSFPLPSGKALPR